MTDKRVSGMAEVRIGRAGIAQLARGSSDDLPDSEIVLIYCDIEHGGFGVVTDPGDAAMLADGVVPGDAAILAEDWLAAKGIPEGADILSPGHGAHALARMLVDAIDDAVLLTQPPPPLTAEQKTAWRHTPPGVQR